MALSSGPERRRALATVAVLALSGSCLFSLYATGVPAAVVAVGSLAVVGCQYALTRWATRPAFETVPPGESRVGGRLERVLSDVAERVDVPRVVVGETDAPVALVTYAADGRTLVVSEGMIDALDDEQLRAMCHHECAHLAGRHPEMYVVGRALAVVVGFTAFWHVLLAGFPGDAALVGGAGYAVLWLGSGNVHLAATRHALGLGAELVVVALLLVVSRNNEFVADAAAARATGREALAEALRRLETAPEPAERRLGALGTLRSGDTPHLLRPHPSISTRVARLERAR